MSSEQFHTCWKSKLRMAAAIVIAISLGAPWLSFSQQRPYIGFVYPAGGQKGQSVSVRVGGQAIDDIHGAIVSGNGVSAKVTENHRRLNNQEVRLLNEQLSELKRSTMSKAAQAMVSGENRSTMMDGDASKESADLEKPKAPAPFEDAALNLIKKIEARTFAYVQTPACAAIASIMLLEVAIDPDAHPGRREIRLVTNRGVSNPLAFYVDQFPEYSKKAMGTSSKQVLGKEAQSLRRRSPGQSEEAITLPCIVNGQIGSGEVNHYTFEALKGQQIVISTLARQLVPYIADAVPGWFQPVLALYDAQGREVAYNDDFQFRPDPVILCEVPSDGQYTFAIHDSLYRGREDFVYRIKVGEIPFVTGIFPLGRNDSSRAEPSLKGSNLEKASLVETSELRRSGTYRVVAQNRGIVSNPLPFAVGTLPEMFDAEPNNTPATAQEVKLPQIINGRIDCEGDWDVYRITGKSNGVMVAEVQARILDSPLDSILKVLDAQGMILALNDDNEDLAGGINTHQADSYVRFTLPADGTYYVCVGDTARQGGELYSYRLRLSGARPDFELRATPSSVSIRSKSTASLTVYAMRRDGFSGTIELSLKDPPPGISAAPAKILPGQNEGRLILRTTLKATPEPLDLVVQGTAREGGRKIESVAIPADDQMQAFLWRHLTPASDLKLMVFDPGFQPSPKRLAKLRTQAQLATVANAASATNSLSTNSNAVPAAPKFTKQQVAGRLRQLNLLYEEGMLTEEFYAGKMAECEAAE